MLRYVRPVYPAWAKHRRIAGTVQLRAVIGENGSIRQMIVLGGPKELIPSAQSAVRRWRYRPVALNGHAIGFITEIHINFTLTQ